MHSVCTYVKRKPAWNGKVVHIILDYVTLQYTTFSRLTGPFSYSQPTFCKHFSFSSVRYTFGPYAFL